MVTRHTWINHGRLLTSCPCNAIITVTSHLIRCPECGTIISPIQPPGGQLGEAWRILERRPVVNQNWTPTLEAAALNGTLEVETLDDLRLENKEHI